MTQGVLPVSGRFGPEPCEQVGDGSDSEPGACALRRIPRSNGTAGATGRGARKRGAIERPIEGLYAGSDLVVDPSLTEDRKRWPSETPESLATSLDAWLGEAVRRRDRCRQTIA